MVVLESRITAQYSIVPPCPTQNGGLPTAQSTPDFFNGIIYYALRPGTLRPSCGRLSDERIRRNRHDIRTARIKYACLYE